LLNTINYTFHFSYISHEVNHNRSYLNHEINHNFKYPTNIKNIVLEIKVN